MGFKKRRIWCWFRISLTSWKKLHTKKLLTKTRRKYALLPFCWCQSICFVYNLFCVNFYETFSMDLKIIMKLCVFYTHIIYLQHFFCLYWHFLFTLKTNADKTAQKYQKRILKMCLQIFNLATINGLGGKDFLQKKSKSLVFSIYLCWARAGCARCQIQSPSPYRTWRRSPPDVLDKRHWLNLLEKS